MAHASATFDKLVRDLMKEWNVPGLAIAVIQGDNVYKRGYGFAKLPDEQVTADTLFDCASMSKSFTAAAIALLIDDNEKYPDLQWTTPVSKLLPEDFVLVDPQYTDNVTVEDILSHRSGMPRHEDSLLGIHAHTPDTAQSITRNLRNLPLSRPLRTDFQYTNIMYTAASHLVEKLSGEPYDEFLKRRFWKPLEMLNTHHDISGVKSNDAIKYLAQGYRWDNQTGTYIDVPMYDQPEGQGAGLIFSSVDDWAKWIRAMIKRSAPLTQKAHKELVKPRTIIHEDEEDKLPFYSQPLYAFGWVVESYRGRNVIGHDGDVTGFKSSMRYMPEYEWGIVILTNSDDGDNVAEVLCYHLIDELLRVSSTERVDWLALQRERYTKSQKGDNEDENSPERSDQLLPTSVSLKHLTGKYHNAGYHELVLQIIDDKLQADCHERSVRLILTFEHVTQDVFLLEIRDALDGSTRRVRAEFNIDGRGTVSSLGVAFVEEMEDHLIWFERIS